MTTLDQSNSGQGSAAPVQDNINAYWTGRAPAYDDYQRRDQRWDVDRAAWADILAGALPPAPAQVLDLGTGSGYVAFLLAELGHHVTASDLSTGMLDRARAHAAELAVAGEPAPIFFDDDAVAPDFAPESFDAITNRYLMWTLREPQTALANWQRILRPGGVLVVVDSTWFPDGMHAESATADETDTADDFSRLYDRSVRGALPLAEARSIDATRDLVEAAGFAEVTVEPLTAILELDRAHGVAPGHHVQTQHLIRAVRA